MTDVNNSGAPVGDIRHIIRPGNGPISSIAASPDGAMLMVTNYGDDTVSVIDTASYEVVETVAGLDEPFAIAFGGHEASRAYVSTVSPAYDSITVIDASTNSVIATHPLALSVSDLAASPDGKHVYATRNGARGADVAVLDTTTGGLAAIDLPVEPGTTTDCVCVSPDGGRLYVGTNGPAGGRLVVIGAHRRRVLDTVEIGFPIRDVALGPDGSTVYVASCASDWGTVVDLVDTRAAKLTATRKLGELGGIFTGLTLSGDGKRAYLASDESVAVLCTLTLDVIGTVEVASQPSCVVEGPNAGHLYVGDYSGNVTVVSVARIAASCAAAEAG
ncbi:YncE family protein [Mycobacterium sp.]|uniref:YncE family protein n=1 Tax=Mycobacterium sp. TaxID=1785 RepID=UPI0025EBEEEB|nr:YncE family protein [Mycobacterium sp.]MBW0012770.1 YncE family protein [Mycobacterium sp.]